jgi:molybdenum-dependent DNA-binding transcriptional regulator ModE
MNIPAFEKTDDFVTSDNKSSGQKESKETAKHRIRDKIPNESIDNDSRLKLLNLIENTCSIRQAAKQLGIKNSTAKSIYYKYK